MSTGPVSAANAQRAADELEAAIGAIVNGTRRPGSIPMEPMARLIQFARGGVTGTAETEGLGGEAIAPGPEGARPTQVSAVAPADREALTRDVAEAKVRATNAATLPHDHGLRAIQLKRCHEAIDRIASLAAAAVPQEADRWQPLTTAPLDGTWIELLVRHQTWWVASKAGQPAMWEQVVRAHWVDFNGGGWTWAGMAGTPWAWRALPAPQPTGGEQ